ncbi:hypothetical protein ABPG75_009607 [Micractinium tetrahymenae]
MEHKQEQGGQHPHLRALLAAALSRDASPPAPAGDGSRHAGAPRAPSCSPACTQTTCESVPLVLEQPRSSSPPLVHKPPACDTPAVLRQLLERQRLVLRQQRREQDEWAAAAQALLHQRQAGSHKRKRVAAQQEQDGQGASPGQQGRRQPTATGHGKVSRCITRLQRQAAELDRLRWRHLAAAVALALTDKQAAGLPEKRAQQAQQAQQAPPPSTGASTLLAACLRLDPSACKPEPPAQQQAADRLDTVLRAWLNKPGARRTCRTAPTPLGGRQGSLLQRCGLGMVAAPALQPPVPVAQTLRAAERQRQWAALFCFLRDQLHAQ